MSSDTHDIVEHPRLQESLCDQRWEQEIVPRLPAQLEEQAWACGAMCRKSGKLAHASDLLRGLLAYVLCVSSFRQLGAWGVLLGIGDLADTSWRERLRKASEWLCWLLGQLLLPERLAPSPWLRKAGYGSVELVDATHLKCVGVHGKVWRIHCLYSLLTQQVRQVLVTSAKVAENLQHFVLQAGNIYVHDGGYGYRDRVAQSSEAGAFTVTAFSPCTFPLQDEQGKAVDVIKWLKRQRAAAGRICSRPVFFQYEGKRFEARVVALRRTKEQTDQARRRKCKKASKEQRKLQPETLYLAGWVLVLTTLPAADWSDQEVLSLYRARWHIELLFKRIKQLLSQHRLRAQTEETAKATVYAILVGWMLQQEVAQEIRESLQQMQAVLLEAEQPLEEPAGWQHPPISEWQVQALSVELFCQQVRGGWTQQRLRSCLPQLRRHLGERPRKRPHRWQQVTQWLQRSGGEGSSRQASRQMPLMPVLPP
jgi:hypothetical protein